MLVNVVAVILMAVMDDNLVTLWLQGLSMGGESR